MSSGYAKILIMVRYLIVEDEPAVASFLAEVAGSLGGQVHSATTLRQAREVVETYRVDIALVDLRLPDGDGIELIPFIKAHMPEAIIIVITSVFDPQTIVRAIKEGASEYITKPVELAYLQRLLGTYQELIGLKKHSLKLTPQDSPLDAIVGESPDTESIKRTLKEVAQYDSTVLITGPTGVGKNLFAEVLHRISPRARGPFVVFDCTTVPEHLIEAELFGYVRGAFTGADRTKEGLVMAADGGTLFIDEIGELPLPLQSKFLRLLDTGQFRMVGSNKDRVVDIRVVAATNRSIEALVKEGRFREDLYYRLNVLRIEVPPLSKRPEDVLPLANLFLRDHCQRLKKHIEGFSPDAEAFLKAYSWPGNVRELKNMIERAVIMASERWITKAELCPASTTGSSGTYMFEEIIPLKELERRYIEHVLAKIGGNKTRAAELLGISRKTLREKLKD